ncbi:MAG: hypothetical protein IJO83_00005, partial [Clostridia bacterium]|nr:hypothetical protein [Clostridia bacterium]
TENLCEIVSCTPVEDGLSVSVKCYDTRSATLAVSSYEGSFLSKVTLTPIELKEGETITLPVKEKGGIKLLIWDTDTVKPLCAHKTIE